MKLNNLRTRVTALLIAAAMTAALAPAALAEDESTESTEKTSVASTTNEEEPDAGTPVVLDGTDEQYAEGKTIEITNSGELTQAILNQKKGQTWNIAAGEYVIGDEVYNSDDFEIGGEKNFVFPITVDDLTIVGNGDVTITSNIRPNATEGGVWHNQNFITISGTGVTIEGVKLKGNPNDYYDGVCNKAIELYGGKNLTLKNVELLPLTYTDPEKGEVQSSGSIYFNVEDAGNCTLENVTLYSWISASTVKSGTITATNIVEDFTDNVYAGYSYQGKWSWSPAIKGDQVTVNGFTIKVDNNINFVKQITDNLRSGTTIELTEDITVDEMAYIKDVDNITINGNDHKITASDNFAMGTHGQINLFKVESGKGIVLNDVNLVATAANKHTLDLYLSEVALNNVSLDNSEAGTAGAPLILNGSQVDVGGSFKTVTGDNSWYAINLDNKNGPSSIDFNDATNVVFEDKSATKDKAPIQAEANVPNPEEAVLGADKAGLELSPSGQFIPKEIHVSTVEALKAAVAFENANIVLDNDIELTSNLAVAANGVTINGNGRKIFATGSFAKTGASSTDSLVTVTGSDLTLKNITLQTGVNNAHALNLFQAQGVVLDNVTLDHTTAYKGAPLVVASSEVTAQNGLKVIAGAESWYGINLDNGTASNQGSASLTFADENVTFVDNSGKDLAFIKMDTNPNVTDSNTVVNPGNADLIVDENGNYVVCDHSKTEIRNNKDATPDAEGYTGDTYCSICGKLLSTGTVVPKVDEHPEIGEAIANGTWGKDEATATPKPATSAAGSTATVTNNTVPQTADEMNLGLLMMLLVVSAAGLTGTVLYTRKNKAK